jgi:hypothetical protein
LCELDHWRLERVAGAHPGYLISVLCLAGHVHFAAHSPLYTEARSIMREWEREVLGEGCPALVIEDRARGQLIMGDGCERPLARDA